MSKIRIHQGSRDLYVNVISVNSRYVDFIIHNDLSIDMKVPVGMSWEMIERYVRLNETMIFEEYEKKKVRNHSDASNYFGFGGRKNCYEVAIPSISWEDRCSS